MTKLSYFSLQQSPIHAWHWEIHQQKFWMETIVTKHESPFQMTENPKSTPQLTLYGPCQSALLVPSSLNFLFHQVLGGVGDPHSWTPKMKLLYPNLACLVPQRTTAEWASIAPKKLCYRSAPPVCGAHCSEGQCILRHATTSRNSMELTLVTNTTWPQPI